MTNTRIEAAVQAEVKRIEAWNQSGWLAQAPETRQRAEPALALFEVRALANHLVRNRIQVEDARRKALVEACKLALDFMVEWDIQQHVVSGLSLALHAALKAEEEAS